VLDEPSSQKEKDRMIGERRHREGRGSRQGAPFSSPRVSSPGGKADTGEDKQKGLKNLSHQRKRGRFPSRERHIKKGRDSNANTLKEGGDCPFHRLLQSTTLGRL